MNKLAICAGLLLVIPSFVLGQGTAPNPPNLPGAPGAVFVPLPLCRILNTLAEPAANDATQGPRRVDLRSTRCGRIVPSFAIGVALRTVSYNRNAPDHATSAGGRAERQLTLPVQANVPLNFTVTPNEDLAADVYGYFVAQGTPVGPAGSSFPMSGNITGASTQGPHAEAFGRPTAQYVTTGDKGEIYLDASVMAASGVLMTAPNANSPWITAKLRSADGSSGFALTNSASNNLLTAKSDGAIQLLNGAFLDGRTDYFGSDYYGHRPVPTNIVHDVTLVDPYDSTGGTTNRVVFYNAQTDAEYGSPNVTKYRAFTDGYPSDAPSPPPQHINFDSQIRYHFPGNQLYHFRAFSTFEGKDTFWVRPETNGTVSSNTRADMYVSGLVGIGTTTPRTSLNIIGAFDNSSNNATLDSNKGLTITSSAAGSASYALGNKFGVVFAASNGTTTNNFPVSGIMAIPEGANVGVGGSLILQTHTPNDATLLERVRITSDGKVGIGLPNPAQQLSVAGTIQTSVGVLFPDGLQTAAYPFTAGTNTADLNRNVAGPLTSSVTNTNTSASGSANLAAIAGSGAAYVRLASSESTPTRDWRVGMSDSSGVFKIRDNVANVDRMTITGAAIHFNGDVDGTTVHATYQDLAEWVPAAEIMPAGTVVVVAEDANNTVTASTRAYDTSVAGVVSLNPGLLLGVASESKAKIATTGRVRVRVDATRSPIHKGDLLVTSDRPGMAMKSEPIEVGGVKLHRPGTLIGKALEPLADGEGEILVLLSLQ